MTSKTPIAWLAPVILGSTLPGLAFAQANDETTASPDLSPLVVTATRNLSQAGETPQKVTVITREQIKQQLAITQDPGQVLSNLIPSYSPSRQKLSNAGETFRGRSPLFLIDGVPQSNPLRDMATGRWLAQHKRHRAARGELRTKDAPSLRHLRRPGRGPARREPGLGGDAGRGNRNGHAAPMNSARVYPCSYYFPDFDT